jgi:hypothetical protein
MNCPKCGEEARSTASKFCGSCGAILLISSKTPEQPVQSITSSAVNTNTKACPYCGETILAVAIKCKHCGSNLGHNSSSGVPPPSNVVRGATYRTTWAFFFKSGPGYWQARPTYWIGWVIGFLALPIFGIGMGIWVFLFVASMISRGDWRKDELQRAIEAKK